jgi:hypothetical protein
VRAAAAAVGEAPGQKGVLDELETFDDRQTFRGAKDKAEIRRLKDKAG